MKLWIIFILCFYECLCQNAMVGDEVMGTLSGLVSTISEALTATTTSSSTTTTTTPTTNGEILITTTAITTSPSTATSTTQATITSALNYECGSFFPVDTLDLLNCTLSQFIDTIDNNFFNPDLRSFESWRTKRSIEICFDLISRVNTINKLMEEGSGSQDYNVTAIISVTEEG